MIIKKLIKTLKIIFSLILVVSLISQSSLYAINTLAPTGITDSDTGAEVISFARPVDINTGFHNESKLQSIVVKPVRKSPKWLLGRPVEIVASIAFLSVLAIPMILVAVAIKIDEPSLPVIYRDSKRVGLHGQTFTMYKFRTLKSSKYKAPVVREDDRRLKKLGRFLRRTALDELPRFLNVLKGDMSLFGRMPPTRSELLERLNNREYLRYIEQDCKETPGIFGAAQLAVPRRSHEPQFIKWIEIERNYRLKRNLFSDIKIVFLISLKLIRAFFPAETIHKNNRLISKDSRPLTVVIALNRLEVIGGQQRYVSELAQAIAKKYPVRLHILYFTDEQKTHSEELVGRGTIIFHPIYYPGNLLRHVTPTAFWKVFSDLRNIRAKEKIDLINIHTLSSPSLGFVSRFMSWIWGIPLMTTTHRIDKWEFNIHGTIGKIVTHLIASLADLNSGVGRSTAEMLGKNTMVIGSFIDTDRLNPDNIKIVSKTGGVLKTINQDKKEGKKIIVCAARILPSKGQLDLIEIAQHLKELYKGNFCIYIIGPTNNKKYKKNIEAKIKETGLESNVKILGEVEFNKIREIYLLTDVAAVPKRHEALGLQVLEAQAMKIPVVAYNLPGIRDCESLLFDKSGFLVKLKDTKAMAEKIAGLLNNPEKAKQMGIMGRRFVNESFELNINDLVDKFVDTWEKLVQKSAITNKARFSPLKREITDVSAQIHLEQSL